MRPSELQFESIQTDKAKPFGLNVELNSNLDRPTRSIRLKKTDRMCWTNLAESSVELFMNLIGSVKFVAFEV